MSSPTIMNSEQSPLPFNISGLKAASSAPTSQGLSLGACGFANSMVSSSSVPLFGSPSNLSLGDMLDQAIQVVGDEDTSLCHGEMIGRDERAKKKKRIAS